MVFCCEFVFDVVITYLIVADWWGGLLVWWLLWVGGDCLVCFVWVDLFRLVVDLLCLTWVGGLLVVGLLVWVGFGLGLLLIGYCDLA